MSDEQTPPKEPEAIAEPEPAAEAPPIDPEEERRREIEENDRETDATMRRLTRRALVFGAAAAALGYSGWRWLRSADRIAGVPWPLRRMLLFNETLAKAYYGNHRLSPTFSRDDVVARPRVNGHIGLTPQVDAAAWRLSIIGSARDATPVTLDLDDIRSLPVHEQITEFKCIEGWSQIVQWRGARMSDLIRLYPPPTIDGSTPDVDGRPQALFPYVSLETPGRAYYVGLDMASALHPQTLLAWEINGKPLDWHHGAPLRLVIPVKYGIKNIKRIATIRYSQTRPGDFWGDRGYDWYAGL